MISVFVLPPPYFLSRLCILINESVWLQELLLKVNISINNSNKFPLECLCLLRKDGNLLLLDADVLCDSWIFLHCKQKRKKEKTQTPDFECILVWLEEWKEYLGMNKIFIFISVFLLCCKYACEADWKSLQIEAFLLLAWQTEILTFKNYYLKSVNYFF